jgi:hypothetical protein
MIKARTDIKPAGWQITATTINCDYVDEAVTIMVDKDWTTRCTWYRRYKQKANENGKAKFEKEIRVKIPKCAGTECPLALNYRDKLIQEELVSK